MNNRDGLDRDGADVIASPWTEPGVHGPYAHDTTYYALFIDSEPDGYGRRAFRLVWWDGARRRGQYFRANVAEQTAMLTRPGDRCRRVVVIENVFAPVPNPP